MAALESCCPPCPQPPVNIPGAAGPPGTDGMNGVNAFSTIASYQGLGFVVPAVDSSATIFLTDTGEWMAVGQIVFIQSAGLYSVTTAASVNSSGTSVQLQNIGAAGNAAPGTNISAGQQISPGGDPGVNAYTATSGSFTVPALNSQATIDCYNTNWMVVGQTVFVEGGGYLQVASVSPSGLSAVLSNIGYAGTNAGAVCPTGSGVGPAGPQGSAALPTATNFFTNSLNTRLSGVLATFGTITLGNAATSVGAGTWIIFGRISLTTAVVSSATFPQATAQLSSSTQGALTQSVTKPFLSTAVSSGMTCMLPPTVYPTLSNGDVISLQIAYLTQPSAGITVTEVSLCAICLNLTT